MGQADPITELAEQTRSRCPVAARSTRRTKPIQEQDFVLRLHEFWATTCDIYPS